MKYTQQSTLAFGCAEYIPWHPPLLGPVALTIKNAEESHCTSVKYTHYDYDNKHNHYLHNHYLNDHY